MLESFARALLCQLFKGHENVSTPQVAESLYKFKAALRRNVSLRPVHRRSVVILIVESVKRGAPVVLDELKRRGTWPALMLLGRSAEPYTFKRARTDVLKKCL